MKDPLRDVFANVNRMRLLDTALEALAGLEDHAGGPIPVGICTDSAAVRSALQMHRNEVHDDQQRLLKEEACVVRPRISRSPLTALLRRWA